jgi:hypothetical protein
MLLVNWEIGEVKSKKVRKWENGKMGKWEGMASLKYRKASDIEEFAMIFDSF